MRGRHDTNRLYGPRWNRERYLTFGLPAGRRMPPRKRSRVRDLCGLGAARPPGPTEDARARPRGREDARSRRVLAHPVERARAASCVVPRGASRFSPPASPFVSRLCRAASPLLPALATPLDALSLPETATCAPLSLSLPRRAYRLRVVHAVSYPLTRAAKMRWFRGREAGDQQWREYRGT